MAKYRKKPVVPAIVEAEQWWPGKHVDEVEKFTDNRGYYGVLFTNGTSHVVTPSDYIIKDGNGRKYVCKFADFKTTYEKVEENN